ncbi:MAG: hypothetical protein WDO16_18655 [Bacteroidota bacterium]
MKGLQRFPKSGDLYMYFADFLFMESGNPVIANSMYQKALRLEPDNIRFNNNYAAFLYISNQRKISSHKVLKKIEAQFEKTFRLDPDNSIIVSNLANFYYRFKHDIEKAKNTFKIVFEKDSFNPNILFPLCEISAGKQRAGIRQTIP